MTLEPGLALLAINFLVIAIAIIFGEPDYTMQKQMDDLIARLRSSSAAVGSEAAEEIIRLRTENRRLWTGLLIIAASAAFFKLIGL